MLTITLNLSPKVKRQLEKDFQQLETITEKPRDFHLEKALIRYLEQADKLIKHYEKERKKGNKNYTVEELLEHLNLKQIT